MKLLSAWPGCDARGVCCAFKGEGLVPTRLDNHPMKLTLPSLAEESENLLEYTTKVSGSAGEHADSRVGLVVLKGRGGCCVNGILFKVKYHRMLGKL